MERRHATAKILITCLASVGIIVLFGIGIYALEHARDKDYENADTRDEGIVNTTLLFGDTEMEVTHNLETYLLIGTDDSGNAEAEGTDEYLGQMADFQLLLVLDKTDNTYGFLQIDRNTMTEVPLMDTEGNGEGTAFEQICIAHWYGGTPEMGCNNTVYCVGELLGGLPIDGYYSIHMSDLGTLNHMVGGVEVTIDDDLTMVDPAMKKGATIVLTDEQAEKFVRARMGVGKGDNASRMSRQQQFMQGFKVKAKQKFQEDPQFVNDLFVALEKDAVTDISQNQISRIANRMYKSEDLGTLRLQGKTKIGDTLDDGEMHEEFYADKKSIMECLAKLCGIDKAHIVTYEYDDEDIEEDTDEDID